MGEARLPDDVVARDRRREGAGHGSGFRRPFATHCGRDDASLPRGEGRDGDAPFARERLAGSAQGDGSALRNIPYRARRRLQARDPAADGACWRGGQGCLAHRVDARSDPSSPQRRAARPDDPSRHLSRADPRARRHRARDLRRGRRRRRRHGADPVRGRASGVALIRARHEARGHQGQVHPVVGPARSLRSDQGRSSCSARYASREAFGHRGRAGPGHTRAQLSDRSRVADAGVPQPGRRR